MNQTTFDTLQKRQKLKSFSDYILSAINESTPGNTIEQEIFKGNILVDNYTRSEMIEKIEKMSKCAEIVEIREYDTPSGSAARVHNANYCHNPIACSTCAAQASKKRKIDYEFQIKEAARRYKYSYMITYTIKDGPDLKERIDKLANSMKRFRKMGQKRSFGNSLGEHSKIKAAINNIENKLGENSGQWHVHIHSLIFTDELIDYAIYNEAKKKFLQSRKSDRLTKEELLEAAKEIKCIPGRSFDTHTEVSFVPVSPLSSQWYKATKQEAINIKVNPLFKLGKNREPIYDKWTNKDGKYYRFEKVEDAIYFHATEVLKYNTKLSDDLETLSSSQFVELIQRRGKRRLLNPVGSMRCDSRNPDALTTREDKEQRKQDYKVKMDGMEYKIFSSIWKGELGRYSRAEQQNRAALRSSDSIHAVNPEYREYIFKVAAAQITGKYRSWRSRVMKLRAGIKAEYSERFEKYLDKKRSEFRKQMKEFWKNIHDWDYWPYIVLPAHQGKLKAEDYAALRLVMPTN